MGTNTANTNAWEHVSNAQLRARLTRRSRLTRSQVLQALAQVQPGYTTNSKRKAN